MTYNDDQWPPSKSIQGFIIGPQDSPYANGLFAFTYNFPEDFLYSPPELKILTSIVHPAVVKGKAHLSCLKENWEGGTTLREALLELQEELVNPNFEGCANRRVLDYHRSGQFLQKTRRATRSFAK